MLKKQPKHHIMLVDDEEGIRFTLSVLLKKEGYHVEVASCLDEAQVLIQAAHFDLVFIDIMLGGENGIDLLRDIKKCAPATQIVMFTGSPQVESAAEALRLGAFDYITKPVRFETLIAITRHALSVKEFNDQRESHRASLDAIFRTVTDSIVMIGRDGCLVKYNTMAETICGYRTDLIGSVAADMQLGCGGGCRLALQETLNEKAPRLLRRIECHPASGKTRLVTVTATPVMETDGSVSGAVAVIHDETELVELERSLKVRGMFHDLIGSSVPMQRVFSLIESLANVPTTVLINGESGTGKELVAAALHETGSRAKKPFVKVNCSALSEHLLESELFGHIRGAFTGAIADKIGRFQKAHGGTLFLDEIGDISPAIQMRLLRVLQESEFERVGESSSIKVDVRIVAATNQSLADKVSQGTFRQDLYYRLNVVRLDLPPLRERLDDLKLLIAHFISHFNSKFSRSISAVSDDVMSLIKSYHWPGNVRELEHAIEHACILCKTTIISVSDLPQDLLATFSSNISSPEVIHPSQLPLTTKLSITEALAAARGNKARAAKMLGISRMTLYRQLGGVQ